MRVFVTILLAAIVLAVLFVWRVPTSSLPADGTWIRYTDEKLGVSFSYPPEWGTARREGKDGGIVFTNNSDVTLFAGSSEGVQKACPQPKTIHSDQYCKLFTNDEEYLYEFVSIVGGSLQQYALVEDLEFHQQFPGLDLHAIYLPAYLQSILGGTATPAVLDKIDTFEAVMLSLELE